MITNLKHQSDGSWTWRRAENSRGCYYTDCNGEGVFFQSDITGETKQLIGTCQFSACMTVSGMRRKLNNLDMFKNEFEEDPRI